MLSWPTGSTSEGNKTKRRLSLFKQLRPPQSVWEMGLTELELQHWYAWGMANVQTAIFLQRVYKVVFRGGRNDSLWACKQRWLLPAQHHHLLNPEPDQGKDMNAFISSVHDEDSLSRILVCGGFPVPCFLSWICGYVRLSKEGPLLLYLNRFHP